MKGRLEKAIEDRSFAKELLFAEQERSDNLLKKLRVLQVQQRTTEKIWFEEVSRLSGQLLVEKHWLPPITWYKLFQTATFVEFLNQCAESPKASAITKVLDDVMATHPDLDLTGHDSYDPEAIL